MDNSRFRVAAWLNLFNIPLTFITIAINMWSNNADALFAVAVNLALAFVILLTQLYVLTSWKVALNRLFDFHDADAALRRLIAFLCVVMVARVATTALEGTALNWLAMGTFVVFSLLSSAVALWFLVCLLRLRDDLGGFRKAYCFVGIITAICELTIILTPLALLTMIVQAVLAAMIFFHLAQREPSEQRLSPELPQA